MITTRQQVKTYLSLDGDEHDNKIDLLLPYCEEIYLKIRRRPFELDEENNPIIPPEAPVIVIKMVGFELAKDYSEPAVISKRLSDLSVSYADERYLYGFPLSIVGGITRYLRPTTEEA